MTTLSRLIAKLGPELRAAFLAAIEDLRSGVDQASLTSALEHGDIDGAIQALNIEPGAFAEYATTRYSGFARAGAVIASEIDGISFRFDMTNPRAEGKIRDEAAIRVQGYTAEQIETARKVMADGFARGEGPQTIAVDIAGRVNRVTGRREGGIVGLSEPQAEYVKSVKGILDGGEYRELFVKDRATGALKPRYTLLDGRDLRTIKARIKSGKPLSESEKQKILGRYTDRLIKRRAEDIARTETAQGVMLARAESYQQALDKAGLPGDAVTKTWRHLGGLKDARVSHVMLNEKSVQGIGVPFIMPDGTAMQHSHDPAGGVRNNANCACDTFYAIDFGYSL